MFLEGGALLLAGGLLTVVGVAVLMGKDVPGAIWTAFGMSMSYWFGRVSARNGTGSDRATRRAAASAGRPRAHVPDDENLEVRR